MITNRTLNFLKTIAVMMMTTAKHKTNTIIAKTAKAV